MSTPEAIQGSGTPVSIPRKPAGPMTMVRVSVGARDALREMAQAHGISQRELAGLLINYAYSIHKRPGSWGASAPFNLSTYTAADSVADKWFQV